MVTYIPTTQPLLFLATALSAADIVVYLVSFLLVKRHVPESVSETFYELKHHIIFSLVMWTAGLLMLPELLAVGRPHSEYAGLLAVVGLLIVGAAPRFRSHQQNFVHNLGGVMAGVGSQAWVLLNRPVMLSLWAVFLLYIVACLLVRGKVRNPIFAAEITSFLSMYSTLFLLLLQ